MTGGRKACYISPLTNLIVFYLLYWFQIDIKIKENAFIALVNFPCTDKGQTVPTCSSACLSFSFAWLSSFCIEGWTVTFDADPLISFKSILWLANTWQESGAGPERTFVTFIWNIRPAHPSFFFQTRDLPVACQHHGDHTKHRRTLKQSTHWREQVKVTRVISGDFSKFTLILHFKLG